MLINCEGFNIGKFYIPQFNLLEGELITIFLYHGAHFYDLSMSLVDIFTGKKKQTGLILEEGFVYAKHFKENRFNRIFCPTRVEKYIKNENIKSEAIKHKIYEIESEISLTGKVEAKAKMINLKATELKLLSLYSVFNRTDKIIFDLVGQSPQGALKTVQIVKSMLSDKGGAILLDGFDDESTKNESSKWIKISVNE